MSQGSRQSQQEIQDILDTEDTVCFEFEYQISIQGQFECL